MFKNKLKKFRIEQSLTWIEMPELGPKARIQIAPATDANPQYYNAMLKLSGKRVRTMIKTDTITAEDAAQNRDDDRELYPMFVIRGWEYVEGDEGEGVVDGYVLYNRRHAQLLCQELPPHLMDRMRNVAATPERFYAEDEILPPDAEELSGNSESD